ncbi:MAG: GNAT family N-acetyltransferase [Anaerolineaceae bacterium]|nr:GNAT family N-acetyltransferase [Anaerolineaceae bacterium]
MMKTTNRSFSEELGDFHRLCNFVMNHYSFIRSHTTWCLGRIVDWKYAVYENKQAYPAFTDENAHLWFDGFGELAGVLISESGGAEFAILTTPGYRFLYEEILQWSLEHWSDRGARRNTEIKASAEYEIEMLAAHGFRQKSTFTTNRFDLVNVPVRSFPLEEGFTLVDLHSHPDFLGQQRLLSDAFGGREETDEAELRRRLRFYGHEITGPTYHPQTDICVMAPDGRLVSGCEALIDARNVEADIERVCTHSQFRRRGFARAAIAECLRRLQKMGMRNAYIAGYSEAAIALYGSMGSVETTTNYEFELNSE